MAREAREKTLKAHVGNRTGRGLRPIMTNLNGDNSWLASFPRPAAECDALDKAYYHVVIEPWLVEPGAMITLGEWFSRLDRNCVAVATDGAGVNALVREIEDAAGSPGREEATVDAIVIGHYIGDHANRDTLLTFSPAIPVFTAPIVTKTISGFNHFERVVEMSVFGSGTSWKATHSKLPLPSWLSFISLKLTTFNYGLALAWSHGEDEGADSELKNEAILFFPHGWELNSVRDKQCIEDLLVSEPPLRVLAMMHPLKEGFAWGMRIVSGVRAGLRLWQMAKPAYWLNTADQELLYSGAIMKGVWDARHTLSWGLKMEQLDKGGADVARLDPPNFVDLENGYNYVLE